MGKVSEEWTEEEEGEEEEKEEDEEKAESEAATEKTQSWDEEKLEGGISMLVSAEERYRAQYPMDTLYSWLVLAAGFTTYMAQMGFITSFGIYAEVLSVEFEASVGATTFAGGLTVGIMSCTTVLGAMVYRMLGSRLCVVCGATWAILGFLAASQAQTIAQLYVANFIIGLGFAFNVISISSAQVDYFIKFRIFALSFQSVGAGVGTTVMPELLHYIIQEYGWRGSFVILSGACGFLYVVAAILASRRPRLFAVPCSQIFHVSLLKRKTIYVFCFICFLWGGASYSFLFLIDGYMASLEMKSSTAPLVTTVLGLCSIAGRVASSILSQLDCTNRLLLNAASCAIWSLATICFQWPKNEAGLVAVGAMFGTGMGLMYPSLSPIVLELFGAEVIATSQAVAWFCLGVGCLLFPYVSGLMVELDGVGYKSAYSFLGATGLLAAALTAGIAGARALRYPVAAVDTERDRFSSPRDSHSTFSAHSIRDSLRDTNAPLSVGN